MLKNFRDKIAVSGITVLMIGVALLVFTFISAYGFLTQTLSVIASEDLVATFGAALAPLITTCIHIMYLGVMGWVGSLLTIRGVTIMAHTPQPQPTMIAPQPITAQANHQAQQKPTLAHVPAPAKTQTPEKAKPEKPKEEPQQPQPQPQTKPYEPEIVVIPPEQQVAPEAQQPPQQNQQQKNENNGNSAAQPANA
jgi:hypothetical protein